MYMVEKEIEARRAMVEEIFIVGAAAAVIDTLSFSTIFTGGSHSKAAKIRGPPIAFLSFAPALGYDIIGGLFNPYFCP